MVQASGHLNRSPMSSGLLGLSGACLQSTSAWDAASAGLEVEGVGLNSINALNGRESASFNLPRTRM